MCDCEGTCQVLCELKIEVFDDVWVVQLFEDADLLFHAGDFQLHLFLCRALDFDRLDRQKVALDHVESLINDPVSALVYNFPLFVLYRLSQVLHLGFHLLRGHLLVLLSAARCVKD